MARYYFTGSFAGIQRLNKAPSEISPQNILGEIINSKFSDASGKPQNMRGMVAFMPEQTAHHLAG